LAVGAHAHRLIQPSGRYARAGHGALFSPGQCLTSGRTSRGPPGRASASSES
jgi:hypothetical protein